MHVYLHLKGTEIHVFHINFTWESHNFGRFGFPYTASLQRSPFASLHNILRWMILVWRVWLCCSEVRFVINLLQHAALILLFRHLCVSCWISGCPQQVSVLTCFMPVPSAHHSHLINSTTCSLITCLPNVKNLPDRSWHQAILSSTHSQTDYPRPLILTSSSACLQSVLQPTWASALLQRLNYGTVYYSQPAKHLSNKGF